MRDLRHARKMLALAQRDLRAARAVVGNTEALIDHVARIVEDGQRAEQEG